MAGISSALGIGGALLGGLIGARGQQKAGQRIGQATDAATQFQREMFERMYNEPFNVAARSQGGAALDAFSKNVLAGQYGQQTKPFTQQDFQASPLYGALTNAYKNIGDTMGARAAASGMLGSGNMQSALQQAGQQAAAQYQPLAFNQFMAQNQLNQAQQQTGYNALRDLIGIGQGQTNALMGLGGQSAGNIGNWLTQGAGQQAQADISRHNIWGGMLGPIFQGLGGLFG